MANIIPDILENVKSSDRQNNQGCSIMNENKPKEVNEKELKEIFNRFDVRDKWGIENAIKDGQTEEQMFEWWKNIVRAVAFDYENGLYDYRGRAIVVMGDLEDVMIFRYDNKNHLELVIPNFEE